MRRDDETMEAYVIRLIREDEREQCARVAENPGFIQAQDTEWDIGVNYAKAYIARAIRLRGF